MNPADGLCAMGFYPGFAPSNVLPATLGLEGMGEVVSAAPDVADIKVWPFCTMSALGILLGYTSRGRGFRCNCVQLLPGSSALKHFVEEKQERCFTRMLSGEVQM